MIRSWRNSATRKVWECGSSNQFRRLDVETAIDLVLALNAANSLRDLSPMKSVGLHKLKGDRGAQWAMTVNERWRICFEFCKGDAYEVVFAHPGYTGCIGSASRRGQRDDDVVHAR